MAVWTRKLMPLGCVLLAAGCSSTLETGYQPHRLGAGPSERRAFYAEPFSPESKGKAQDNYDAFKARRPDSY